MWDAVSRELLIPPSKLEFKDVTESSSGNEIWTSFNTHAPNVKYSVRFRGNVKGCYLVSKAYLRMVKRTHKSCGSDDFLEVRCVLEILPEKKKEKLN